MIPPGQVGKIYVKFDTSSQQGLIGKGVAITTNDPVALGDMVIVEGKLLLNQDYGSGYTYDVIIEDAKITTE